MLLFFFLFTFSDRNGELEILYNMRRAIRGAARRNSDWLLFLPDQPHELKYA